MYSDERAGTVSSSSQELSRQLIADAGEYSLRAFCSKHPYPFLLGDELAAESPIETADPTRATLRVPHLLSVREGDVLPSDVRPVRKVDGSSDSRVTLGRKETADIALAVATVSSVHAVFEQRDGKWLLSDGGSRNGTYHLGQRLGDGEEREVKDGDALAFGPDARFRFYESATVYHMLRGFVLPKTGSGPAF